MDPARAPKPCSSSWLPRAGGDGPTSGGDSGHPPMAPPRRRGWTPRGARQRRREAGSPAQAGMDPSRPRFAATIARLPRAGGDGPRSQLLALDPVTAPPRRRGWTRAPVAPRRRGEGSPAQAGMDPRRSTAREPPPWLPRAGGDGPYNVTGLAATGAAPPRRRGWTRSRVHPAAVCGGSPAQAGMDRAQSRRRSRRQRLPRAGGDGPNARREPPLPEWAPPRRRGWTQGLGRMERSSAGSPAQAGMDPSRPSTSCTRRRLPRAGGDGPRTKRAGMAAERAPPRRRGWTRRARALRRRDAGSPAQAGMDPSVARQGPRWAWLPRAGGDGPVHRVLSSGSMQAPPRRRGWLLRDLQTP